MKQNKVAITGGIGSGKSTVSSILREMGYVVFDCDEISRQVACSVEVLEKIKKEFGSKFVVGNQLQRKKLAEFVFADAQRTKRLNEIMHPPVISELKRRLEECGEKIVFAEVPLLFETGMDKMFDNIWIVVADENERINRVQKRDSLDEKSIKDRIKNQTDYEKSQFSAHTIIKNDGDLKKLAQTVRQAAEMLNG